MNSQPMIPLYKVQTQYTITESLKTLSQLAQSWIKDSIVLHLRFGVVKNVDE